LAHMSISTYYRPNIHQNGPEILGVNTNRKKRCGSAIFNNLSVDKYWSRLASA
jgi:hypothetical protein